jgi:tripartite-type tricarboxylate transporter receptor subunit TctC
MAVPLRGSPAEMCGQQFKRTFGASLVDLLSTDGEAGAVKMVLDGAADVTCASTASVRAMAPALKGNIRELAEVRSTASPFAQRLGVDSTAAQGFDVIAPNWLGLFAPAGMDARLAREISAAIVTMQSDPSYAKAIASRQALPVSAKQATPQGLLEVLRLALALQR